MSICNSMNDNYLLEFEVVTPIGEGSRFYRGDLPICKPNEVPDEFWHKVSKQTSNPWQQFNQLKDWATSGEQLVRNVQLFKAANKPQWEPVT